MRNPRRTAGPIRRTIVPATPVPARPASNLTLRTVTTASIVPVRRTRSVGLSGAQQNSDGSGLSPWAQTPYLHPVSTEMTPAWSRTVSDRTDWNR
jgi:hypothetical protein